MLPVARQQMRVFICSSFGVSVEEYISSTLDKVAEGYLQYRKRQNGTISEKSAVRYKAELEEAAAWFRGDLLEYYFGKKKERELALIEYPLLSYRVAETMRKKGLRYRFETVEFENILTIPMLRNNFLKIPLTLDNCEQMLDLLDYFRARPECIKKEHPEIKIVRDYWLAQAWEELKSGII